MSSVGEPGILPVVHERLKLDATSFQRLLAAAWAIQCQHDAERQAEVSAKSTRITIPDAFFEPAESPLVEAVAHRELPVIDSEKPGTMTKIPPQSVRAVPETAGALALATDRHAIAPKVLPVPRRVPGALRLVDPSQQRTAAVYTIRKRDFRLAVMLGAAVLLLAAVAAMWGFRTEKSQRYVPHDMQPSSPATPQRTSGENKPVVESSHMRLTDSDISAAMEQLSRYELQPLRRQATFGDDQAALLLGMSYETGQSVRQDCVEATHWIRVAAEEGNAAAQYNLGLRYLYGDGVAVDKNASRKWLRDASKRGYKKAQDALREFKQ